MNRVPRDIDFSDWEKLGEGNTAETYSNKTDEDVLLKLYSEGVREDFGYEELLKAEAVTNMGIRTPKAIEFVKCGNRFGAIFEKVQGKKSFARLIGDNPKRAEELSVLFARKAKELHSTPCNKEVFPSAALYYESCIKAANYMNGAQKERALSFLYSVPSADTCIHGDLHFGNIVMDKFGEVMFIDLPEFCYGNPMFDFGMGIFTLMYTADKKIEEDYHMSAELYRKCWDYFFREYFGLGSDAELEKKKNELRSFAGLSVVYMSSLFEGNPRVPGLIREFYGE